MSEDIITTRQDEMNDLMEAHSEVKSGLNVEEVKSYIRQMATLKKESEMLAERMSDVKSVLTAAVENFGETDGRGHINLEVGDASVGIASLQLQRRSTPQENIEAIERILKGRVNPINNQPLWDNCIKYVPVVQEDEVMKASFDGLLTEEDIAEMYPRKISYAFFMNKA